MSAHTMMHNTLMILSLALPFGSFANTPKESKSLSEEEFCQLTRFATSTVIIEALLEDLSKNYDHVGGEINHIKATATNVYQVAISQEERIDQITYEVAIKPDCAIDIIKKSATAVSPWQGNSPP